MDRCPLSVVILNHNREELLRRVLRALGNQSLADVEILVVDNASTDRSAQMVKQEFPEARLLALTENSGIRGRNLGMQAARGELILSIDNDIELVDPTTLARIAQRFRDDPALGAVTLKICEEASGADYVPSHWWHPRPREEFQDREFPTDHFNEAAVAFRAEVVRQAGYYYEPLFWGGEEWDLALGILDQGYELRYLPLPVLHLAPRGSLITQATPRHALLIRNRFWIALRRLPVLLALVHLLPRIPVWAVRSVRYGYFHIFCRGILAFLRCLPEALRSREPVSRKTLKRARALRAGARRTL